MRVLVLSPPNAAPDRLVAGLRAEGVVCDTTRDLDDLPSALALSGPYDLVVLDLDREAVEGTAEQVRKEGRAALALAGFFLVRYSIEVGLVTPPVRVALGALFGEADRLAAEAIRSGTAQRLQ